MATVVGLAGSLQKRLLPQQSVRARLARNTLWSIVGSASSQGSSLLAALVIARMLGVTRFGQLALIQATVFLMGTLGEMGISLTETKFVSRWRVTAPKRTGRLIGWSLSVTAISALLMIGLLAGLEPYLRISSLAGLSQELKAGYGLLLFEMLNRVQFGALAGLEAFGAAARVHLSRSLLMPPSVWLGTWFGGLAGAILAMAFVGLVTFAIGHWVLRNRCTSLSIPIRYRSACEPEILSTSMALWISTLLAAGSTWAVTLMLSRQPSGLSELGLYHGADRWKTALLFLPNMLFQVTLPMLSHSQAAGDYRACGRIVSAALSFTAGVTGAAAMLVFGLSHVLMSWYGAGFAEGSRVLSLAALVSVVSAVYTVGSGVLWAIGRPALMLRIDFVKTFLLLTLCWVGYATSAWNLMLASLLTFSAGSVVILLAVRTQLTMQKD